MKRLIDKTNGMVVLPSGGGVNIRAELHIDTQALLQKLAPKAYRSKAKRTGLSHGLIVVKVFS